MFNEAQENATWRTEWYEYLKSVTGRGDAGRASTMRSVKERGQLIPLGPRLVGQPDYEVDQMITARIAGRTTEEVKALVRQLVAARKTADQGEEKRPAVSSTTEAAEKFGPQFGSPRGPRRKVDQARDDAKQKALASPRPKSARRNGSGRKPAPDEIGRTT